MPMDPEFLTDDAHGSQAPGIKSNDRAWMYSQSSEGYGVAFHPYYSDPFPTPKSTMPIIS